MPRMTQSGAPRSSTKKSPISVVPETAPDIKNARGNATMATHNNPINSANDDNFDIRANKAIDLPKAIKLNEDIRAEALSR